MIRKAPETPPCSLVSASALIAFHHWSVPTVLSIAAAASTNLAAVLIWVGPEYSFVDVQRIVSPFEFSATQTLAKAASMGVRFAVSPFPASSCSKCPKFSEESNPNWCCNYNGINCVAKDASRAHLVGASAPAAQDQSIQNGVHAGRKCFRIRIASAPVAQSDRASAF